MLMPFLSLPRHVARVRALAAALVFVAFAFGVPASAVAGVMPPDYGMSWRTIGDPGNRLPNAAETPPWAPLQFPYGSVNHTYRLTTTEVTNRQYIDFVRAYLVFNPGVTNLTGISGFDIQVSHGTATHLNGDPDFAANMSWEYAARYANWLHNNKAMNAQAFEQGVYDTSTFYRDANGVNHHQNVPSPGAKYWIPTTDEWIKAAFWDPRKNNGAGGYWTRPNGSDTPLVPGIPGITPGAQTSAGTWVEPPVGYFPEVTSPWGLLDMSGGVAEMTSTVDTNDLGWRAHGGAGSSWGDSLSADRLSVAFSSIAAGTWNQASDFVGLRLASAVPSPSIIGTVPMLSLFLLSRKRT